MSKINEFLKARNLVQTRKAIVKLKGNNGKENEFEIEFKSLTAEEYQECQNGAIRLNVKSGESSFDNLKFQSLVLAKALIEPNLKNAELQQAIAGRPMRVEEMVPLVFKINEITAISNAVLSESGIEEISVELLDKAKK